MEEDKARSNPGKIHVAQAGPNPEPMHKDFIANVYLKFHESLKPTTKEHPPTQTSSAWKTFDIREAPSRSSKQKLASPSEQLVDDVPILDDGAHLSESKDTGAAYLPKIKTRTEWLKLIPEEDTPKTPKPDWVIPPNDLLEPGNNWANALAKTYKYP
uniref:Uncharacterized protein n=1 Tax=Tanacetum cinerariifolium TaxID=118510 RepID=A0A6L2P0X4_TANCI|nr:hypothetical protein [Tanacetum cinerariifolium]